MTFLTALSLSDSPSECVCPRSPGTSGVLLLLADDVKLRDAIIREWFGVGPRELVLSSSEQLLHVEPTEYFLLSGVLLRILCDKKMFKMTKVEFLA